MRPAGVALAGLDVPAIVAAVERLVEGATANDDSGPELAVVTRAAVVMRLLAEIEAAFPGDQMEYDASVDDVDALKETLVDALDDLREQIDVAEADP